jgi:hypothetical protein
MNFYEILVQEFYPGHYRRQSKGRHFDPETFSVEGADAVVGRLPWSKRTGEQLIY